MCGIAGIVNLKGQPVERSLVERLCATLVHRGPDAEGVYLTSFAGLGQRRLSIIDLSTGKQPMSNEDGSVWVTFNGEIYNFQALRAELEQQGHHFASRSDTEVIVHAYEQHGAACVTRFRGMFAFAIWDAKRRTLLLARDHVGKKPLFYSEVNGQFVFASEMQALLQHPGISKSVDPAAIDEYLTYGYIPAPRTGLRGVFKLPPAHTLLVEAPRDGSAAVVHPPQRFWELEYGPKLDLDDAEAAAGLLECLTEAVKLRMVADVPLGALLSGGVDSSLIVALMSRASTAPVKTFSIGFEEKAFNELPYARMVAQRYGTDHHELIVRPDAVSVLPLLVRHYGEPYADSSAVPSYYVARMTREHVTVALNGDGGDEAFAGYERYLASGLADRYARLPAFVRRGIVEPVAALIPDSLPRRNRAARVKRLLQATSLPFGQRYARWLTYFTPEQKHDLYTPAFRDEVAGRPGDQWLQDLLGRTGRDGATRLDALLGLDVQSYLPYDLLVKMDIATMANSLEVRSPLLDRRVMEYAARLPDRQKIRGTTLKFLLKKVAKTLLPPEILTRRKMGFGVPVGVWMKGELRPLLEATLLSPQARTRDYLRPEPIRRMLDDHVSGVRDHAFPLWALLWLEMWHREFSV